MAGVSAKASSSSSPQRMSQERGAGGTLATPPPSTQEQRVHTPRAPAPAAATPLGSDALVYIFSTVSPKPVAHAVSEGSDIC